MSEKKEECIDYIHLAALEKEKGSALSTHLGVVLHLNCGAQKIGGEGKGKEEEEGVGLTLFNTSTHSGTLEDRTPYQEGFEHAPS